MPDVMANNATTAMVRAEDVAKENLFRSRLYKNIPIKLMCKPLIAKIWAIPDKEYKSFIS